MPLAVNTSLARKATAKQNMAPFGYGHIFGCVFGGNVVYYVEITFWKGGDPLTVDLHIHTCISDGSDTPAELLCKVKAAGIDCFSVTDHDAVKGAEILRPLLGEGDPLFIPGAEFSCREGKDKYHILGYGFDPAAPSVTELVRRGHDMRMEKVLARLDFLANAFGFTFPKHEIDALTALDNPGKPHIGNLMVKYGYTENRKQAIRDYIDRMHFSNDAYLKPREAIEAIRAAGGIPVLAHPFFGSGDELILGDEMEERLRLLMDWGLEGIEVYYSGFTEKLRAEALALAQRYGLYATAGSDYHGANKLVQLGDTGLSEGALPAPVARFMEVFA